MKPIWITLFVSMVFMSCGQPGSAGYKELPPDEVIRRHIQFLNEKNVDAAESCIVKERRNQINWQLQSQKNIRIVSLKTETNPAIIQSYMETGRGSITHPYKVTVFLVELEKQYNSESAYFKTDKDRWYYFVVKQTEDSPWLIDDWGV